MGGGEHGIFKPADLMHVRTGAHSGTCSVSRKSASGSYSTTQGFPATTASYRTEHRVGRQLAGLLNPGDDGWCGFDAPTHGLQDQLSSAAGSLTPSFFSAASTRSRKTLWSSKIASPWATRRAVATSTRLPSRAPSLRVEQLLAPLLGAGPCGRQHRHRPRRPSVFRRHCPNQPGVSPARRRRSKLPKRSLPNSS